ncbi:hypothetical protein RSOLAG22IIIB_05695 [Rhizoctonia solani]|uniref:Uncharacterized protein n=1 Tax=Rhizoctonia solani TaxID=456999 RepID=A0A0K6G8F7_9AGAM|nr:hypothetical protein RSOLAG22IIIB_05695 [Rhizoctonia solani]
MSAEFEEAQVQRQLDELSGHIGRAFSEYAGSLDSEPEELDEASINEVLDRVEKQAYGPGKSGFASTDLTSELNLAVLRADGVVFTVAPIGITRNIPGIFKIWGELSGKVIWLIKNLPLGYFIVLITGAKGRLIYISKIRQKVKQGTGAGTWNEE